MKAITVPKLKQPPIMGEVLMVEIYAGCTDVYTQLPSYRRYLLSFSLSAMSKLLSSHPDDGFAYEVCSIASSTETADNLPGPGRTLGKLYSHLGSKVENGLGKAAAWMGHNPKGAVSNDQDSLPFSTEHPV